MTNDIFNTIKNYYNQLALDTNHRFKSWEHCYGYFSGNQALNQVDICCLHLSFYLASWGMYRGSSFILWKDYRIHVKVVEKLLSNIEFQDIDFTSVDDEVLQRIIELIFSIKNIYIENIKSVNGVTKTVSVTDTLATKILLGCLGCTPAYDRYFIAGMKSCGINGSKPTKSNLASLVKFYISNIEGFSKAQDFIHKQNGPYYPPMKLLDMYFWEIGFKLKGKQRTS